MSSQNFKIKNGLSVNDIEVIDSSGAFLGTVPAVQASFDKANTATNNASVADQKAVSAGIYANSAFGVANTALSSIPSLSGYATENYVDIQISNLVDSAPTTLNTLNELAAALGDDANFATTVSNTIGVVGSYANSAYSQANTATTDAATADQKALNAYAHANNAYNEANTAYGLANTAFGRTTINGSYANSAFIQANTADQKAVISGSYANSSFVTANSASLYANSAYIQANTATTNAAMANQQALTSGDYANSAYIQANTATFLAQSSFDTSNTSLVNATSASSYANSAFNNANTANQSAVTSGDYANSAFNTANTASLYANSAFLTANIANQSAVISGDYANSAFGVANTTSVNATSAGSYANSAYTTANSKFNSTGGFITGFANVSSNLSVGTYIDFPNDVEDPTYKEGRLYYDPGSKSVAYYNDTSSYIHIGQDTVTRVWNNSGATLPRANCVFISGESSANGFPSVFLASADTSANSEVIGLTTTDIPNGAYGFVLTSGRLQGLNTSLIPEGSELFLSATEPGKFTTSVPDTPNVPLNIGYITNSDLTEGVLLVNIHLMEGSNKTTGSILFARDGKIDQDNADLYWDYQNLRLGIGTNNPTANLHVIGSGLFTGNVTISGNLLVSNAQSITTSQLTVGGNTIILNDEVTGSPTSNADIIVNRGTSPNVYIRWSEDINEWVMFEDAGYAEGHILHSEKTFSTWEQYQSALAYEKSTHPIGGDLANTTNENAKAGFQTANIASSHAVAGYNQANTATTNAATADQKAVSAGIYANGAFNTANTALVNTTSASSYANGAFNTANTALVNTTSASSYANSAFGVANTASVDAISSGTYANSAYSQANTATTNASTADQKAVSAGSYANSSFIEANTANQRAITSGNYANSAFDTANTVSVNATSASSYANSAFNTANTATTNASVADQRAVTSGSYANSAFNIANTASINSTSAGSYANGAFTVANTASINSTSAGSYANGAFNTANSKFASSGGTISGNTTITGNLTVGTTVIHSNRTIKNYGITTNVLGSGSGSRTIDLTLGNFVTATVSGATTWTFSNPVSSPDACGFILELTNGGSATQTWTNVRWPGGTAPTLTASGVDILTFVTDDAGANWRGVASMLDSK
jgi:hypothetical protein